MRSSMCCAASTRTIGRRWTRASSRSTTRIILAPGEVSFNTAYDNQRMTAYLFLPGASNRPTRSWCTFRRHPRFASDPSKRA